MVPGITSNSLQGVHGTQRGQFPIGRVAILHIGEFVLLQSSHKVSGRYLYGVPGTGGEHVGWSWRRDCRRTKGFFFQVRWGLFRVKGAMGEAWELVQCCTGVRYALGSAVRRPCAARGTVPGVPVPQCTDSSTEGKYPPLVQRV